MCGFELSENCGLRLLEEPDAQDLHDAVEANRDHLSRWMPWAAGQTLEDTRLFIQRTRDQLTSNDGFQVGVVLDGQIAGVVGFHSVSWQHRATSIGYWLADSAQGRGIMTCSVRVLADYAFSVWRLHRIEIRAGAENTRSRAIPERLGFKQEGVLRDGERVGDRYLDLAVYSVLACEWPRSAPSR